MNVLDAKISEFTAEMKEKLIRVAYKHGGIDCVSSVTADTFDWSNPETARETREHLLKEIAEWLLAETENERNELRDIANCCMILSMMKKAGA